MHHALRIAFMTLALCLACSPAAEKRDGGASDGGLDGGLDGGTDGGTDAGGCASDDACPSGSICTSGACVPGCTTSHACAARMICVQGQCQDAVNGLMGLVEVEGALPADGGTQPAKLVEAFASFHKAFAHDYDDRHQDLGCTGDHYDAQLKPLPSDENAGWLRISGFTGGTMLSGSPAGQPIGCMLTNGHYACTFPSGDSLTGPPFASFPDSASPLGEGSILFATQGASAFGPKTLSATASGTLSVAESLNALSYSTTSDTVLHLSCTDDCTSARVAVQLIAVAEATLDAGWPYPSIGVVSCVLPLGSTTTIPAGAVGAMFAQDARLDTVWTTIVRLPGSPPATTDSEGNPLVGEVGRGVFGVAPR